MSSGTKFVNIYGELDPAKLIGGVSIGVDKVLSVGLVPRMHHGIFAITALPELDGLVPVGVFNVLKERGVQICG